MNQYYEPFKTPAVHNNWGQDDPNADPINNLLTPDGTLIIEVPHSDFRPRPLALPVMKAFNQWDPNPSTARGKSRGKHAHLGVKRIFLEWPRQYSKDTTVRWMLAKAIMNTPNGRFMYCFPKLKSIRNVVANSNIMWNLFPSKKTLYHAPDGSTLQLPKEAWFLIDYHGTDMRYTFANGATLQLAAFDTPDSLIGDALDGIIVSEWQNCNPAGWKIISPMLTQQRESGFQIFIGTPRGKNFFSQDVDLAKEEMAKGGNIFGQTLTVEDTKHVSPDWLYNEFLREAAKWGYDAARRGLEQEFWCSRDAGAIHAVFPKEMAQVEQEQRIVDLFKLGYPHPDYPIHTAWDMGYATGGDATVCVAFQIIPTQDQFGMPNYQIIILDYIETNQSLWLDVINQWIIPNQYDRPGRLTSSNHKSYSIFPWEFKPVSNAKDDPYNLVKTGLKSKCKTLPSVARVSHRIQALRHIFHRIWFNTKCEYSSHNTLIGNSLLKALREAEYPYDDELATRSKPKHDWCSHFVDAMTHLAMGVFIYKEIRQGIIVPEVEQYQTQPFMKNGEFYQYDYEAYQQEQHQPYFQQIHGLNK